MIRIIKVNDGIVFTVCTKKGAPVSRMTKTLEAELKRAQRWYEDEVSEAFIQEGLRDNGYARDFMNYRYAIDKTPNGVHYRLNPWGFAERNEAGEPVMANSGSTPTPGRAKVLLCYQAPLARTDNGGFSIVKEFP